ncbi:hypothetical protein ACEYW6_07010 [Nostoc sp. UIC 10607]|uniref:hypothetical protein n=1 Tax=Nostoc sp. UIC 10607 TaxID=3045935 RepID=UPI0039A2D996
MQRSDVYDGLRQRTTPEFSIRSDRLCEGHCEPAIAPNLSLVERAIACMKVILNKRSHFN